jgi:hypothetical protein
VQFNGHNGYIAVGDESVAYGTAAGTPVYQHAVSSGLKAQENRVKAPVLGGLSATTGIRLTRWSEGSITLAHTDEDDEVGVIYSHLASASGSVYTFGGTPTVDSHTVFVGFGGIEYEFTGCVARSITWTLNNGGISTIGLDYMGRYPTKQTEASPSRPPESEIITPGDLDTFTVGGTAVGCLKSATITFSWPATGTERIRLGSDLMPQPIRSDRPTISGTFTLELDDATGSDTIALLDDMIADSAGQAVVLDQFSLGGVKFMGNIPDLSGGLIDVPLTFEGTSLTVETT